MLSRFSNLSHKRILHIADLLLEDDDDGSAEDRYDGKAGAQATELTYSGEQAIFNLSRTSTFLYKFLSSYLFRNITLRNSAKSGQAVQYLCSTSQIANIKTLHFKGKTPAKEEEDFRTFESIFPAEVNDILSNLSRFPCLATLIIDFDVEDHWTEVFYDLWRFDTSEGEEEIKKAEEQKLWRALIKKTLEAISTTCSDSVRDFVFKQYPILPNSVLGSVPFNEWLGKLESFRFELYGRCSIGQQTDALGVMNRRFHMTPQFPTYFDKLDYYFLDAIRNVTRLAIVGDEQGVIGRTFWPPARFPLRTTHVPKLKELELGYFSIQADLLDFLVAHSSTLEHLIFNNSFLECTQNSESSCVAPGTWKSWFQDYASQGPRALQRVTFLPYRETGGPLYCSKEFNLSIKQSQFDVERKAEMKKHRMFLYGMIEPECGTLVWLNHIITQRLLEEDLDGWYELMAVVTRNRERVKGEWILDASGDVSNVRHG
ncbi:hypothetical protein JMJ35_004984 [Cladonia borealis]|uniref:F-box/LRR-repeat protein 15/At3g58940/PEG3-like LRR domain-containing protein n=1 Tax=Cladonia borealis TaxID=184061 RepID=A0AA39V278_9LECA|nr:hypothetical protein JMJ35_004984 [Cladonia borealis]